MISVKVKGISSWKQSASKAADKMNTGAMQGTVAGAEQVLRDSNAIVPIDSGNLRNSGKVRMEDTKNKKKAAVGYSASYAVFVHENLDANHKNGQAKFLQKAVVKDSKKVVEDQKRLAKP